MATEHIEVAAKWNNIDGHIRYRLSTVNHGYCAMRFGLIDNGINWIVVAQCIRNMRDSDNSSIAIIECGMMYWTLLGEILVLQSSRDYFFVYNTEILVNKSI